MRLLQDCTILCVGDDDGHGAGIKVWRGDGWGGLGKFQNSGMAIYAIPRDHQNRVNENDRLVMFVDEDHRDAHWQTFREAMLAQHRVYIPDDLHAPEYQRGGLWPVHRWVARWLPMFAFAMWVILPIAYWVLDMPTSFIAAISMSIVSLMALSCFYRLRKGMI